LLENRTRFLRQSPSPFDFLSVSEYSVFREVRLSLAQSNSEIVPEQSTVHFEIGRDLVSREDCPLYMETGCGGLVGRLAGGRSDQLSSNQRAGT
jgi:hypothetical protein